MYILFGQLVLFTPVPHKLPLSAFKSIDQCVFEISLVLLGGVQVRLEVSRAFLDTWEVVEVLIPHMLQCRVWFAQLSTADIEALRIERLVI
jgi:hypothetical protein